MSLNAPDRICFCLIPSPPPQGGKSGSENFLQKLGRSIESRPKDKVFATWYNSKGDAESIRTFHGIWEASGEVNTGRRQFSSFSQGLRIPFG